MHSTIHRWFHPLVFLLRHTRTSGCQCQAFVSVDLDLHYRLYLRLLFWPGILQGVKQLYFQNLLGRQNSQFPQ